MSTKPFKVQAAAQLLATTNDTVRRMVDESGIEVARQQEGTKTRLFSIENIFELARYSANRRSKVTKRRQIVATVYTPSCGVGKTTLASNFGAIFALRGLRTLVIDLDFRAGLTRSFGYDSALTREEALEQGVSQSKIVEYHFGNLVANWPSGRVSLLEAIKKPYGECGPHLIPADVTLDGLDAMLADETSEDANARLALTRLIKDGLSKKDPHFDVSEYDVILFDAAPARSGSTYSAMLASDFVISPVSMENFSTKALSYLSAVLTEMRERSKKAPDLVLVGNFFDPNRIRVMGQLLTTTQGYPDAWLERSIRRSEEFSESLDGQSAVPLVLSKPSGQAAVELRDAADVLLRRMGLVIG
ncbi:AAA family ATPase [Paraburkholderia hospita]|uniref:ParA family protein n=1 Tax=Paraburkholderia hospita TaxID=169430 RepID=UPI003ECF5BFE